MSTILHQIRRFNPGFRAVVSVLVLFVTACGDQRAQNDADCRDADSLTVENRRLRALLEQRDTARCPEAEIKIDTIRGHFVSASRGDCFHLTFKDNKGKTWQFDNPSNHIGSPVFDFSDGVSLKKGISKRAFKLWIASLQAVVCEGEESYAAQEKFALMPVILRTEEIR